MENQANRNYVSNDRMMTPQALATGMIGYFKPSGDLLEPCSGDGAFVTAMQGWSVAHGTVGTIDWCEIDQQRDFFEYSRPCDWLITNPPWSMIGEWYEVRFFDGNDWGQWMPSNTPLVQELRKAKELKYQSRKRAGFLEHSLKLATNVVFLITVNHLFTTFRKELIDKAGFGIKEIVYVDWPKEWNKSGFLLGACHLQLLWKGGIKETDKRGGKLWSTR